MSDPGVTDPERPDWKLIAKLQRQIGESVGRCRKPPRQLYLSHDEIDAWRAQFDLVIPVASLAYEGIPIVEGEEPKEHWRSNFVPAPHFFNLNQACKIVNDALAGFGCYLVGSSIVRREYRDVDVRYIMEDTAYDRLFRNESGYANPLWSLMCQSISLWLSQQSGLPVDFQIQRQTRANEEHHGRRQPLGIFLDYPGDRPSETKT